MTEPTTPPTLETEGSVPEVPAGAAPPGGPLGRVRAFFGRHEFLRHFTVLVSGTAIAQVIQIVAMVLVARLFTPVEMGVYTLVLAAANLLVPIAALRYDMAIVLPSSDNDARRLVRIATCFNTIMSALYTVLMFAAAGPIARLLMRSTPAGVTTEQMVAMVKPWLYASGLLMWLLAQVAILTYWLTRTKDFRTISQNRVTRSFSASLLQVLAGVAKTGIGGLMIATMVGQLLQLVNLVRRTGAFWRRSGDSIEHSTRELLTEYRKMPLLNGPNALVDSARLQGIPLLITRFGAEAVGQFGTAWRLLQAPMGLINGAIQQIFFQKLSVTKRGQMFRLIRQTTVRSLVIGIVPFAAIYFLGPILVPWLLGARWQLAGQISAVLVPWLYLNFVTSPISTVFVMAKRQGTMLVFALFYAAVPLGILWRSNAPLLTTLSWMSWAMFALLVVFIALALWVSHTYDRSPEDEDAQTHADQLVVAEELADDA